MTKTHLSLPLIISLTIIGLLPLLSMVSSTHNYELLLTQKTLWKSFYNSMLLALFVATSTTVVGTFLAILLSKTKLYLRYFWSMLLIIPLLIPPYIIAYGWYEVLGRDGFFGELLFGFWGTALVLFSIYLPIVLVILSLFIRQINPKLEESALLMASWRVVLLKITLPLLFRPMILSFLIVLILAIGEFSVANFFHYPIFPMESFIQFSAFYDFETATLFTLPLLLLVVLVLMVGYIFREKTPLSFQPHADILTIPIKNMEIKILLFLMLFIGFTILLPFWGILKTIDISSLKEALTLAQEPLTQSFFYAFASASLLTFVGFLSAYALYKKAFGANFLNFTMLLFFILPSIFMGIALILFWNHPLTNFIYSTPIILLLAYLIKYLLLSTKIIELKLKQIKESLIESVQLTGATNLQVIWYIVLPSIKDSLIIAWVVAFIFSLRDSSLSMLVAPAGTVTLPTYIFTQMANGKEGVIASLCFLIVFSTLLIFLLSILFFRKRAS